MVIDRQNMDDLGCSTCFMIMLLSANCWHLLTALNLLLPNTDSFRSVDSTGNFKFVIPARSKMAVESRQSRECNFILWGYFILDPWSLDTPPTSQWWASITHKWVYSPNQPWLPSFRQRCVVIANGNSNFSHSNSQKIEKYNPAKIVINQFSILFYLSGGHIVYSSYRDSITWSKKRPVTVSAHEACQLAETELASSSAHSRRDCRSLRHKDHTMLGADGCVIVML